MEPTEKEKRYMTSSGYIAAREPSEPRQSKDSCIQKSVWLYFT